LIYYLAIDIGASSGRHILGHVENGKILLEEMYRFDNLQFRRNGHDCWDIDNLWSGIISGLRACTAAGKIPHTIGIDTWGVDFVLLDQNGEMIGDAVAYRDSRTEGMRELVDRSIPAQELYFRTGIQYQPFNTIYQLMALKQEYPAQLERAEKMLFMPSYFSYLLTGVMKNEYTMATTSNLVNARSKTWDDEIIERLDLPRRIFGELAVSGTVLGNLLPEISKIVGFDAQVMLPATHDTASAFLAVPARDDDAVYLSSGTWSLLGVENAEPITGKESLEMNFTNEGGAWYRYRYLKNIMGLWMIQSIRRELNGVDYVQGKDNRRESVRKWSFTDLIMEAKKEADFDSIVDVNRNCFLSPESMVSQIKAECRRIGQSVPRNIGQTMQCVYNSLAVCYRDAIIGLEKLTGKHYTSINIVGGGCQDDYLNEQTARMTGLPVFAGPIEGTAIGNLVMQMISNGEFDNLQAARNAIRESFEIKEIRV